jgi:hypothetical protein
VPPIRRALRRARRRLTARPLDGLLGLAAVGVTAYALLGPFCVVKYPPLTDLPMHAAVTSTLRHWFDPAWHFREQFELQPLRVPNLTLFVLGAILELVLPAHWAVKIAALILISLLPIGLAVYCRGLKKNATMGVAALCLAWGPLTQWGFVSFVGSLGLTMMGIGLALLIAERPTRARTLGLGVVGVLVFVTHVSVFPVFCFAVGVATLAMLPLTRRFRPTVIALLPSVLLFATWWLLRPSALSAPIKLGWHFDRWHKIADYLFHIFDGPEDLGVLRQMGVIVVGVALYSVVVRVVLAVRAKRRPRVSRRAVHAFVASLVIAAAFALLYFSMPLNIGEWSWVFPREITAATLCALAVLPALPRDAVLRAPALAALLVAAMMPSRFVGRHYAAFESATLDFQQIIDEIPQAPKLGYIVMDRSGYDGIFGAFVHLPAWVQAERGGWLSFHFAKWNATPIRFRSSEPRDVAPDTPDAFEWRPDLFDVATRGKYFDWFLVRAKSSPDDRFTVDPAIHRVDHRGTWWLYRRD